MLSLSSFESTVNCSQQIFGRIYSLNSWLPGRGGAGDLVPATDPDNTGPVLYADILFPLVGIALYAARERLSSGVRQKSGANPATTGG